MKLKLNQKFILLSLLFVLSFSLLFNLDSVNAVTYIHNYVNNTSSGWSGGYIWLEKFTGLWPGLNVTNIGLNVTSAASSHVRVKVYADNGTVTNSSITHNLAATNSASFLGNIYLQKFTGLTPGLNTLSVGYQAAASTGNVRMKIYQDDGNPYPHTITVERNFNNDGNGPEPPSGDLDAEKVTGLTPGKKITGINYKVGVQAGFVRAKIYQDDGSIMHLPSITNNYVAGNAVNWNGAIWLSKITGFPPGAIVQSVSYNVGTQAGNIRMKVYADDNGTGYPYTLLGESGSSTVGGVGINAVPLTATIPASGNLWVGFEVDNAATGLEFDNIAGTNTITSTHTYGSGPNPITGTFGTTGRDPYLKVTYNDYNITGYPHTLLGESLSNLVCGSGNTCNVPLNATVPASGNVWAALEFSDSSVRTTLEGQTTQIPAALTQLISHTYGTGPTPWETTAINRTVSPYLSVGYTDFNITGYPKTLLGESGSTAVTIGKHDVSVSATVPASGNVWAGFETDNAGTNLMYNITLSNGFQSVDQSHSYGAGPSTFSPSNYTHAVWERLTANFGGSGYPGTLLGESGSTALSNGINNISVNAKIPSSGKLYAGFESDSSSMSQSYSSNLTQNAAIIGNHTYGSGLAFFDAPIAQNFAPWMSVTTTGPSLNVSPALGISGNTATLSGTNLGNSNNLSFTFEGHPLTTTPGIVTTNSTGGFSGVTFIVPATSNGVKTINATNNAGIWADAFYTVNPSSFSSNPSSGNVGTSVSFTGTGFSELDTITIKFDSTTVSTLTSDSIGDFSGLFTIPSSVKGSHVITASDTHGNSKTSTFMTNTSISINPTSGSSGNTITVNGDGFASSSNIQIYFNNVLQTTTPGIVTTNSTGSFSGVTFHVPTIPVNTYVVKVIDASSNQATQNFIVHQSIPDAPTLSALALSPTSIRFTSIAGASSGDNPVIWYGLICQTNGGSWSTIVSNSSLPNPRIYEKTGLQPGDIVGCEWRDGSSSGWSLWSNEASTSTTLPLVQPPMTNNHLTTFVKWIADHGGIYFGFTVGPFIPLLLGLMATPKTVGIFAIITLFAMGIVHASGLFVYPAWYWGLMILFGIVLVLSRANEK